jgi:hypothetical protein
MNPSRRLCSLAWSHPRSDAGVEFDSDDVADMREIGVVSEQRRLATPGDGGDHAGDHSARREARGPAPPVDAPAGLAAMGDFAHRGVTVITRF